MLGRLLAILGLVGLAVTQPVLDLLGSSPSTFDLYGVEGYSILWYAVLIAVVPGLVLWALGEAVRAVDEPAGEMVHRVMVGVLAAGFGVLLAKAFTSSTVVTALLAIAIGAGVAVLHARTEAMGLWLRVMAAANLLFLAQFAFISPVADWVESATSTPEIIVPVTLAPSAPAGDDDSTGSDPAPEATTPSVFIVVFDELPTQTLIDENGEIDAVQFPGFASLAADGTHYQRHTTNSAFTHAAVPALFDGKEPQGGPTWTEHPENLFNIFAGTHHLIVSEVVTRLCGFDVCDDLTPPPPRVEPVADADGPDDAPVTTTAVPIEAIAGSSGTDWGGLLGATWDVWVDRLSPATVSAAPALDDFQEDFGALDTASDTTSTTTTTTTEAPPPSDDGQAPTLTTPPADDERTEAQAEQDALDLFFRVQPGAQPERFTEFLAAVQPSDDPVFGFLHLILPHQPWIVREDGALYDVAAERVDHGSDSGSEWPVRVNRQRHVLQTRYTDQILGQFLDHLRATGHYDDSLIVVVGDHGVSFQVGEYSRDLSPGGLPSIAYTPLLIKAPGQTEGRVDADNVSIVDIPLTIADILGIGLPWETVGAAGGSAEVAARDGAKSIYRFNDAGDFVVRGTIEFDDDEAFAQLVAERHPAPTSIDDPLSALYAGVPGADLRGRPAADVLGATSGTATVEALDRLRSPGTAPPLGEIAGRVAGAPDDATVVVAVNGVVVGVSPLYERGGADDSFVVLLPADALNASDNEIRLGLRTADGTVRELAIES
ncbi:MAG: sulfatase-like hydrolase/transferase [Actinomycetota bacterium]